MINSIEISNFKNIRHQKIDLERLTVFVGANGSGKTSLLDSFSYALSTVDQMDRQNSRTKSGESHLDTATWRILSQEVYTRNALSPLAMSFVTESLSGSFKVENHQTEDSTELGQPVFHFAQTTQGFNDLGFYLCDSIFRLKLEPTKLTSPTYSRTTPPSMNADGDGLASTLAYMALNAPEKFSSFVDILRQLIPQLQRIRFTRRPVKTHEVEYVHFDEQEIRREIPRVFQGDSILLDFQNANGIPAEQASEGTLILLGLLTAILAQGRKRILLLDDIDRGLHPLAQSNLIRVLNQLMERFPDLQILATTHSPYLLDSLQPEQVRLMALDDEGYSVCGKLTEHPQFDRWKDEMAPGELWSLFGEKWVAEGSLAK